LEKTLVVERGVVSWTELRVVPTKLCRRIHGAALVEPAALAIAGLGSDGVAEGGNGAGGNAGGNVRGCGGQQHGKGSSIGENSQEQQGGACHSTDASCGVSLFTLSKVASLCPTHLHRQQYRAREASKSVQRRRSVSDTDIVSTFEMSRLGISGLPSQSAVLDAVTTKKCARAFTHAGAAVNKVSGSVNKGSGSSICKFGSTVAELVEQQTSSRSLERQTSTAALRLSQTSLVTRQPLSGALQPRQPSQTQVPTPNQTFASVVCRLGSLAIPDSKKVALAECSIAPSVGGSLAGAGVGIATSHLSDRVSCSSSPQRLLDMSESQLAWYANSAQTEQQVSQAKAQRWSTQFNARGNQPASSPLRSGSCRVLV
jgi:hypothetical protein